MGVAWQKQGSERTKHIAGAGYHHQHAHGSRYETGSNGENSKRKQPKPPEDLGNEQSLAMQTKEQVDQGIQVTFVEDREEIGTTNQDQRRDIVEHIEKRDRHRDHNQRPHHPTTAL